MSAILAPLDSAPTRPVLRWHGGKWRLTPWVLSFFPPHRIYVEPFGGAASVLLRKPRLAAEVYNDLDGNVVNVFRVLRDPAMAHELGRRLRLTPFARAEFDWSYETGRDAIDSAHKMIVRSFMGHGSDSVTRSCRTGFRAKLMDDRALPAQAWANYAAAIPVFTARLMGAVIENRDAREIIDRYDCAAALFYLDPPYPHSTRSALLGRSKATHGYAHELDDAGHRDLLRRMTSIKGMAVISSYPNALYDGCLPDWRRVTCKALADGARPRTEVLWLNPACAAALDAAHAPLFARAS